MAGSYPVLINSSRSLYLPSHSPTVIYYLYQSNLLIWKLYRWLSEACQKSRYMIQEFSSCISRYKLFNKHSFKSEARKTYLLLNCQYFGLAISGSISQWKPSLGMFLHKLFFFYNPSNGYFHLMVTLLEQNELL